VVSSDSLAASVDLDGDSASVLHPGDGDGAPHLPPDGPPFEGSLGSLVDGDHLSLGSGYPADDADHETDALLLAPAVAARAPESPPSGFLLGSGSGAAGGDSPHGAAVAAGAAAVAREDSAAHPPVSMDILTTDRDGLEDLGA